jgi:hypothetical protein
MNPRCHALAVQPIFRDLHVLASRRVVSGCDLPCGGPYPDDVLADYDQDTPRQSNRKSVLEDDVDNGGNGGSGGK